MIYLEEDFMNDEDRLEYSLIMIENELYSSLFNSYESLMLNESGLVYIEESIKETIVRYLNKIVTSLQKSWERFLSRIQEGFIKRNIDKLKSLELSDAQIGSIVIDNFPIYDDNKINSIQVIQFNDYNAMKQYLKDDKTFIGHYYPNIAPKDNEKLKDTVFKYCLKERKDQFRLTREDLQNVTDYLVSYKDQLSTITDDLKRINESCKNINSLVNNSTETNDKVADSNDLKELDTASTPQSQNAGNNAGANTTNVPSVNNASFTFDSLNDAMALLESVLLEAEVNVTAQAKPEPAKGAGAGSTVTDPNKKQEEKQNDQEVKVKNDKVTQADKNSQIVKDVQVYMSASTKVLVAKMRLLRVRCRNYEKIMDAVVNKFDPDSRKNRNKRENNEAPASEELKQINVRI